MFFQIEIMTHLVVNGLLDLKVVDVVNLSSQGLVCCVLCGNPSAEESTSCDVA